MKNLGEEFAWWYGKVEDITDPLQLGRVRVRCFAWHTQNIQELPTEDLPWAQPIQSITSAALGGVGQSPTGMKVGTWVVGFFMDGKEGQRPIIMGTIAGLPDDVHDVDSRARGTNDITKTPDSAIGEPADPYAASYPNNHTYRSSAGHVIEIDDTPEHERIHIFHKSGTFVEMHPNGDVVTQHKNGWRSVTGNDKLHVSGDLDILVDGDLNVQVNGEYSRTVNGLSTLKYSGDKWEHIGKDTFSTNEAGVDWSNAIPCPPRTAAVDATKCAIPDDAIPEEADQ